VSHSLTGTIAGIFHSPQWGDLHGGRLFQTPRQKLVPVMAFLAFAALGSKRDPKRLNGEFQALENFSNASKEARGTALNATQEIEEFISVGMSRMANGMTYGPIAGSEIAIERPIGECQDARHLRAYYRALANNMSPDVRHW
jgi:hypothetical protein